MRELTLYPTHMCSCSTEDASYHSNRLLAGYCPNQPPHNYMCSLTFPAIPLDRDEQILHARLRMRCINACGQQPMTLRLLGGGCAVTVNEPGLYEWDADGTLTGDLGISHTLQIAPEAIDGCALREFEASLPDHRPALLLGIDQSSQPPCRNIVDISTIWHADDSCPVTEAIDCGGLYQYGYFIRHCGGAPARIFSQVSPDGCLWIQDAGPLSIMWGDNLYFIPLRRSRYVRLSLDTPQQPCQLALWFQGWRNGSSFTLRSSDLYPK